MYPDNRPAKQKRATLQSDASRDNRMGERDIRPGRHSRLPTPLMISRATPMPGKLRGLGGRAHDS